MKKLNLADFKMKLASDDSNKSNLLDKLAGRTQATCHDHPPICCINTGGGAGNVG